MSASFTSIAKRLKSQLDKSILCITGSSSYEQIVIETGDKGTTQGKN